MSKQNFASVLRYLGECKREGSAAPAATEMLRRVMLDSPETVMPLGDLCPEVLVSHGPKMLLEALPGNMQARWQQMMAQEKKADTSREQAKKFPPDLPAISRAKVVGFFLTRVSHVKTENKLGLLKSDLHRYPWLGKQTPLHWICQADKNRLQLLNVLFKKVDGTLIDKRDSRGRTALHLAIEAGHVEAVKALLAAGADPEKRTGSWESPKSVARGASISDTATDQIIKLLNGSRASKKSPA